MVLIVMVMCVGIFRTTVADSFVAEDTVVMIVLSGMSVTMVVVLVPFAYAVVLVVVVVGFLQL